MTAPAVPVKPFTKAEAITYLLGVHCTCGAVLTGPGEPCDACGKLPAVSAPEAEEALSSATAIAMVQQRVLEAEAESLFRQFVERSQDAAQVVLVAKLQDARDAAQKVLDDHQARHAPLEAALADAEAAEDTAGADLQPWAEAHAKRLRAVRVARKMKKGPDAVTDAIRRAEIAETECRPWQEALSAAARARQAADDRVTRSNQRGDQLRKALSVARAELDNPPTAPLGVNAILASPWRLAEEGRLDDGGIQLAGVIGQELCDKAGITEEITAEARRELLEEIEAKAKGKPLMRGLSNGQPVALANPFHAGSPQPFHAPAQVPPGSTVTQPPPAAPLGMAGHPS